MRPIVFLTRAFLATGLALTLARTDFARAADAPVWPQAKSDIPADPAIRFGALPNGMRYAIMKNTTPKGEVSMRLRIGAGSLEESDAQQGLAHFLEHMAFRGSAHVPEGDVFQILQRLVGLLLGSRRQQARILALQDVEARHRLREGRGREQRAGRRAGRDRTVSAVRERAQTVLQDDGPRSGHEAHLHHVTAGQLAVRKRLHDLAAVVPGLLRFAETVLRKRQRSFSRSHLFAQRTHRMIFGPAQEPSLTWRSSSCFIQALVVVLQEIVPASYPHLRLH